MSGNTKLTDEQLQHYWNRNSIRFLNAVRRDGHGVTTYGGAQKIAPADSAPQYTFADRTVLIRACRADLKATIRAVQQWASRKRGG